MTMNLHTQTTAPKAHRRPAYPRWSSQAPQKRNFQGQKQSPCWRSQNRPLPDRNGQHHCSPKAALNRGCARGFATAQLAGLPANFSTGTAYSGINIMLLWCSAAKQGFQDERWLTYKQAQELGGQVRKGEHGTTAIFTRLWRKRTRTGKSKKSRC